MTRKAARGSLKRAEKGMKMRRDKSQAPRLEGSQIPMMRGEVAASGRSPVQGRSQMHHPVQQAVQLEARRHPEIIRRGWGVRWGLNTCLLITS